MCRSKKYKVYVHIFPNGKKYYGYTSKNNINERFGKNGCGYKTQPLMWNAIQKYGWDNIEHKVIKEFDNQTDALNYETMMIIENNTSNCYHGYNIIESSNDLFYTRDNPKNGLYSCDDYNEISSCGISNYNCSNTTKSCDTINLFNTIYCEINIYHKFCTTEYAGLVYININSSDLKDFTYDIYKKYKDNKNFIFKCMCMYNVNKDNVDFELVKGTMVIYDIEIIYSLYSGEYYIIDDSIISFNDRKKVKDILNLLDNERILHEKSITSFTKYKAYSDKDDLDLIKSLDKKVILQMRKLCGIPISRHSKLQEENVLEILHLLNQGVTVSCIAQYYNVKPNTIYRIKNKQAWGYMYDKYPELYNNIL